MHTPYQLSLFLCRTLTDTSRMNKEIQWSRPYWDSMHWPAPLPAWNSLDLSPSAFCSKVFSLTQTLSGGGLSSTSHCPATFP